MRPALYLAVSLSVGIAAAAWLRPHPALALTVLVLLTALVLLSKRGTVAFLLLAVAALGALRLSYVQTVGRGDLSAWEGERATIAGTVISEPELRQPAGVAYVLAAEQVGELTARGKLYVTQRSGRAPGFGERVSLSGRLTPPAGPRTPGGYDQAAYLARQGIYLTVDASGVSVHGPGRLNPIRRAAVAARRRIEVVLRETLPPRQAALMAGLLVGSRSDIPDDIKDAFKFSGVFHLLAVSGAHIAMIILPFLWVLRQAGLHRRLAAGFMIPVVIFFIFLTGASPSVMRAGLMAVLVLAGDLLRRERNTLNTLGAAAFFLLLWEPRLLFELGFQFSAAATMGILLFATRFEEWLLPRVQAIFGERSGKWIAAGLSVTFAAQLLVEPLSLYNFGAFSTIAPITNLLIALFLAPVIQAGAVAALLGLVALPVAALLNKLVGMGIWLLLFVVKSTAAVPGAYLQLGKPPLWLLLAWYLALPLLFLPWLRGWLLRVGRWAVEQVLSSSWRARAAALASALLLLLSGFAWRGALAGPTSLLTVTFIDVGQGDATLVQAPGGGTILIDAGIRTGPDPARGYVGYDAAEAVILPYLKRQGIKRLDYFVITHADQDHAGGGAAILRGLPVGAVLLSGADSPESGFLEAVATAQELGVPAYWPTEGDQIRLGPVTLDVINPPRQPFRGTRSDDNANCIAFRLQYEDVAMLLTCDMEAVSEERLVRAGAPLRADLLKAAHHGSRHSSTEPFLAAVQPAVAVISAGRSNPYGHPHPETLERLDTLGAQTWRTDRHGTVVVQTNGQSLSMTGTRGDPTDQAYRPLGIYGRRLIFSW